MSVDKSMIDNFLRVVRTTMDALKWPLDEALTKLVPEPLRDEVAKAFMEDQQIVDVQPVHVLMENKEHQPWVEKAGIEFFYWERLRRYLIDDKSRPENIVNSLGDVTDKILNLMENPRKKAKFDTRGLVVGRVQSGKTANYTALVAKATDAGYQLVIVLTGIHNSLRQQTQRRLDEELVGVSTTLGEVGVSTPTSDKLWLPLTTDELNGDFDAGNFPANFALSQPNPVLIVTKKNSRCLGRLIEWLESAPPDVLKKVACLVIDDEADQASPNTGGNRTLSEETGELEGDEPNAINGLIRRLLERMTKVAYVGYTATPYANVLSNPYAEDAEVANDIYPHSFIVSLPKSNQYFGIEEIFGTPDGENDGLDVLRVVPKEDVLLIAPLGRVRAGFRPTIPGSLKEAVYDFILGGAARMQRLDGSQPATMLIHPSQAQILHQVLAPLVEQLVKDLRSDWEFFAGQGLEEELKLRWDRDFRKVTRSIDAELDASFNAIKPFIGQFLEKIEVKVLNSGSADELDYVANPSMKVIAVGGNRLSRGLTLEGLLVSYYVRPASAYDTLMQMGRWFGYRKGYVDLTRIYTTAKLAGWFRDLAVVEQDLRAEIARYDREKKTPRELAARVRKHPAMMVTSRLKMKHARLIQISFQNTLKQTINFPFADPDFFRTNFHLTREFLKSLGAPANEAEHQPYWTGVPSETLLEFLRNYLFYHASNLIQGQPLLDFIRRQNDHRELTEWVIGVVGRQQSKPSLKSADLGVVGRGPINLIERTRLRAPQDNTVKAIASQADQWFGLSEADIADARANDPGDGSAYRVKRPREQGLLLIYPISKYSGQGIESGTRQALFDKPEENEHVIGLALSFPASHSEAAAEYYAVPLTDEED